MKIIIKLIAIILMAAYSYLQAEIIKVQVRKPKKAKVEYPKPGKPTQRSEKEEKIEYEFVESDKQELAKK